ncbi:MAG: hypothetical protein ACK4UN_04790 [Limisphaerales bacterium]
MGPGRLQRVLEGCFNKEQWEILFHNDQFVEMVTSMQTEEDFQKVVYLGNQILWSGQTNYNGNGPSQ